MTRKFFALACFLWSLAAAGCSLPKIIVLHDPLSAEEHIRLGNIYDAQGKTELAREQYRQAADRDGKNALAWRLSGDLSYRMGEYDDAEKAYRRAMDLTPDDGDLYNNLAWVAVQKGGDLQEAEARVRKAMELKPANRPYYLDTRGIILLRSGKPGEAVAVLQESVAAIPPDRPELLAEAYAHLSEAYTAAGDADGARDALERSRALRKGP